MGATASRLDGTGPQLLRAAKDGDAGAVVELVSANPALLRFGSLRQVTAAHFAARADAADVLQALISKAEEVDFLAARLAAASSRSSSSSGGGGGSNQVHHHQQQQHHHYHHRHHHHQQHWLPLRTSAAASAAAAAAADLFAEIDGGEEDEEQQEQQEAGISGDDDDEPCGVCFESTRLVRLSPCGHRLCVDCCQQLLAMDSRCVMTCPWCRGGVSHLAPVSAAAADNAAAAAAAALPAATRAFRSAAVAAVAVAPAAALALEAM